MCSCDGICKCSRADKEPGPAQETSFSRIARHRATLDDALSSMTAGAPEDLAARQYIVGQIRALDWALGVFSA